MPLLLLDPTEVNWAGVRVGLHLTGHPMRSLLQMDFDKVYRGFQPRLLGYSLHLVWRRTEAHILSFSVRFLTQ